MGKDCLRIRNFKINFEAIPFPAEGVLSFPKTLWPTLASKSEEVVLLKFEKMKVVINGLDHIENPLLDTLLEQMSENKFLVLKQVDLEKELLKKLGEINFNPISTLFIFPGQSSMELRYRLLSESNYLQSYDFSLVHARRIYENFTLQNGNRTYNVKALVNGIKYGTSVNPTITDIVVIDDVISTGITLKNLYLRNHFRFPCARWHAFVLVSRTRKLKNYQVWSPLFFTEDRTMPINTLSILVENEDIRNDYVIKHFKEPDRVLEIFGKLKKQCVFSPHIFCFDLFNTLVRETGEWFGEPVRVDDKEEKFTMGEYDLILPNYIDYLIEQYGQKYSLTSQSAYQFVRDNLMNTRYETFEDMVKVIYKKLIPGVDCTTRKAHSVPNLVEWYWRANSASVQWIDFCFPDKLKRLKERGHKLVLITNCTFPAWGKVLEKTKIKDCFDLCFVSSIEGISKPDKEVWKIMEETFPEFPRNKFVMVGDDPIDDLATPRERGWQVYDEKFLHLVL